MNGKPHRIDHLETFEKVDHGFLGDFSVASDQKIHRDGKGDGRFFQLGHHPAGLQHALFIVALQKLGRPAGDNSILRQFARHFRGQVKHHESPEFPGLRQPLQKPEYIELRVEISDLANAINTNRLNGGRLCFLHQSCSSRMRKCRRKGPPLPGNCCGCYSPKRFMQTKVENLIQNSRK
ncbi:hypothetical protein D3C78_841940 [compost metagenome]